MNKQAGFDELSLTLDCDEPIMGYSVDGRENIIIIAIDYEFSLILDQEEIEAEVKAEIQADIEAGIKAIETANAINQKRLIDQYNQILENTSVTHQYNRWLVRAALLQVHGAYIDGITMPVSPIEWSNWYKYNMHRNHTELCMSTPSLFNSVMTFCRTTQVWPRRILLSEIVRELQRLTGRPFSVY